VIAMVNADHKPGCVNPAADELFLTGGNRQGEPARSSDPFKLNNSSKSRQLIHSN
jgi:hypothetical protein